MFLGDGTLTSSVKELLKDKDISEDDERRGEEEVQRLTDRFIAEVEKLLKAKEEDLILTNPALKRN